MSEQASNSEQPWVANLRVGERDVWLTDEEAWQLAWALVGCCVNRRQRARPAVSPAAQEDA